MLCLFLNTRESENVMVDGRHPEIAHGVTKTMLCFFIHGKNIGLQDMQNMALGIENIFGLNACLK